MRYKSGEQFLNKLYSNMYLEKGVSKYASAGDRPEDVISKYLCKLEKVHEMAKGSKRKMDILKHFYYDKYVIKSLPESYIEFRRSIRFKDGYGDDLTADMIDDMLDEIIKDQKRSLDVWIEYLTSDDAMYPMWFKNYVFQGMVKLGTFDKEKRVFGKRTKTTTAPFISLNAEIISLIYDVLMKQINDEELSEEEKIALINGESFKKLYAYFLGKYDGKKEFLSDDGIWVKYEQRSDYLPLWLSLQGKNTGWCTASEFTAKRQLSQGDFYVYYTKDENGEYKEPRVAIRMDGKFSIAEIRGVAPGQNLEASMTKVAREKLEEFSDKVDYYKRLHDMDLMTVIYNKNKNGEDLSVSELRFLYEIDGPINGFGYEADPRIDEIKASRNVICDLAKIFDCSLENIGTSESDFDNRDAIVYYGDIDVRKVENFSRLSLLKAIIGSASFCGLTDVSFLENLQVIKGDANFPDLFSAMGLQNLLNIGGSADFSSLVLSAGLESLVNIYGDANFNSLTDDRGLCNLQTIGGNANFSSLIISNGMENLYSIGGTANFSRLFDPKGLSNLHFIKGDALFSSLDQALGLNNLCTIRGDAFLSNLRYSNGFDNLQFIMGNAYFNSLEDVSGFKCLQSIGGYVQLFNLITTGRRFVSDMEEMLNEDRHMHR